MSPNVERGSVHFLSLDGEFAGEFDPSANAASYRAQEPQASGSGSAPQVESKRERNRKAARKCRQKAKVNVEWLKDEERELARQNRELKCIAGGLREEVLGLKNELLTHSQYCDSEPIKRYLAKVAGDLINRDLN
ncbi:hypothetical protein GGR53DRAFT_418234 [Hypoxylon sp. FL1150]|nr:hypothetical protein GGR53DRAFT_418234 [Hypoxylon sp. FL1150]